MTIQEADQYIRSQLLNTYEPGEAHAMADWLLEHYAGTGRKDRLNYSKILSTAEDDRIYKWIERLLKQEPLQYVLNEAWFCGFRFYVDDRVLIPRPETEELIEWIISDCKFPIDALSILDIGTGSGCIPISLKRRLGKADVSAIDISAAALEVATRNASQLGVPVNFLEIDFLNPSQREKLASYDVIVSNPPYIPEKDKESMQDNVLAYEPGTALFVKDNDPLVFYKAIAAFGQSHLKPNGAIYVEIHENGGKTCMELFLQAGYDTDMKKDMQGKDRMIRARRNS